MAKLGKFGTPTPPMPESTFEWFGMEVRVRTDFGETTLMEWFEEYGDVENGTGAAMLALVKLLRGLIHPDDFQEFWQLGKSNHQGTAEFSGLVWGVVEALAGRPTERSSESSDGPGQSKVESTVTFLRRATAGRPDLEAGLIETAIERGELVV